MKSNDSPCDARGLARTVLTVTLFLALCGILLPATGPAFGQDAKLPKGDEILDKYIKATGGKEAYKKINNRVIKGTFEMPAQGMKGTINIHAARPNLYYTVVEIPNMMKQERGTDGKIAWERQSMMGARILEGEERDQFIRETVFDSEVDWRKLYKKAETVGVEDIDGKPAHKIKLTIDDTNTMTAYYDKTSNLLVKTVMIHKTQMGDMPVETYISDYKKVGGLLIPHKHRQVVMSMEQLLTFDSFEVNVKMDKKRFALPDDVKELLAQKEEAKKAEKKDTTP